MPNETTPSARPTNRPLDWRDLRVALWIFLSFLVLYVGLTRGRFISTDEIQVYQVTQSIWERGSLAISSPEAPRGRDGHRFAVVNSGISIAAVPLYAAGKAVEYVLKSVGGETLLSAFSGPVTERPGDRWGGEPGIFFVNLFNCFVTAAICALFYCFSRRLGCSVNGSLVSSILLGLTTYIAPFSTGFFQHSSEAFFLLAAFYFLFLDGQSPHWRWRLLGGLMAALLVQFRYPAVMAVPGLLFYHATLVWRRRSPTALGSAPFSSLLRQMAPFVGALVFAFVMHAADQLAKFGTIWSVGNYATLRNHNPLLLGLYAFLFSPGDSIFLFTPLLVLAPWTLRRLYRRHPLEVAFILLQTGVYLFFYGKFDDWHGLWCFGPRYLMALVPLLMLSLGPWLDEAGRRKWLILVPLILVGLWVQATHIAVDFWRVAEYENYLAFRPKNGFLFIPTASQIVAHSRALLAWDSRVDMWLLTVFRRSSPGCFLFLFTSLALLLGACLRQLKKSLRALTTAPSSTSEPAAPTNRFLRLALGGFVVALFLTYSNHFFNGFHFDDAHTIQNNIAIQKLANIPSFFRDATTFSALPTNQSYRPLVSMMLAIDYWLGSGLSPFWFQLSVFALFVAMLLLFAFVLRDFLEMAAPSSRNWWIALLATAAYGLHPANADTVNYVIASSDVISTLGIVASFAVYFAFPGWRRFYLFVLPAALCILAKPPAIVFAVLFAVYRLFFPMGDDRASSQRTKGRFAGWCYEVLPPFLICAAALAFVQYMTPRTWIAGSANPHAYLITQPYVMLKYAETFLWPSGLSADYDLDAIAGANDVRFWIGLGFTVVFTGAAIALSVGRRTRLIGFGLLWFLIGLLPTSLLPLAEVMNDHRTFLPYLGLVMALAGAASWLLQRLPAAVDAAKNRGRGNRFACSLCQRLRDLPAEQSLA